MIHVNEIGNVSATAHKTQPFLTTDYFRSARRIAAVDEGVRGGNRSLPAALDRLVLLDVTSSLLVRMSVRLMTLAISGQDEVATSRPP